MDDTIEKYVFMTCMDANAHTQNMYMSARFVNMGTELKRRGDNFDVRLK